jgi:N-acetylglucosaminyldiphosphoundecaprenol N-acetyl-beta-D-mannosaminyltransferase
MPQRESEIPRGRVVVAGCPVDPLTFAETLDEIEQRIRDGRPTQHCVVNASKAVMMHKDVCLLEIVASCVLVNADGQSVVWASRLLGRPVPERVAGIDLFVALLDVAERRGYSVYFLGATQDVLAATVARAQHDHPGLLIRGSHHGYWWAEDDPAVVAGIREARPDILFVAMPSPRKEFWLAERMDALAVPFSMGVGGSFDVYAGAIRRAPVLLQRMGLEWAYRFGQEPRRMWRRYLIGNVAFAFLVFRAWRAERRAFNERGAA